MLAPRFRGTFMIQSLAVAVAFHSANDPAAQGAAANYPFT